MKNLIICHGSGDGVIAAAAIVMAIGETKIIITQPFLLDTIRVEADVEKIYVLDIEVNHQNIMMTTSFAARHLNKIVLWADCHLGSEILTDILGKKFIFSATEPSCTSLLKKNGYIVPLEWVDAANALNRPIEFPATELSKRYKNVFEELSIELEAQNENNMAIEQIRGAFIQELTSEINSKIVIN